MSKLQERINAMAHELVAVFLAEVVREGYGEHVDFVREVTGEDVRLIGDPIWDRKVMREKYGHAVQDASRRLVAEIEATVKTELWGDEEWRLSRGASGRPGMVDQINL